MPTIQVRRFLSYSRTVLNFFNNLWGPGTKQEQGSRTGPPGYISWRNRFLGINFWAPQKFKNIASGHLSDEWVRVQRFYIFSHQLLLIFTYKIRKEISELQMKGRCGGNPIVYKCLVPIHVFPEMIPKQNYDVLSPSFYTLISVRDLYISRIGLPILLQGNMWTDPGII